MKISLNLIAVSQKAWLSSKLDVKKILRFYVISTKFSVNDHFGRKASIPQVDGSYDEIADGVDTTCTLFSLRCPLGLCMINGPAHGKYFERFWCFDLKTCLLYNRKARSKA